MARRTRRTARVDELLKQEVARVLPDVKDPRVGFVTVVDVDVSPDLRHATVHVSVLGEEAEKEATLWALRGASGFIRSRVGQVVTLKFLPDLHFELDRSLEKAARLDALIQEMRSDTTPEDPGPDEPATPEDPAPPEDPSGDDE